MHILIVNAVRGQTEILLKLLQRVARCYAEISTAELEIRDAVAERGKPLLQRLDVVAGHVALEGSFQGFRIGVYLHRHLKLSLRVLFSGKAQKHVSEFLDLLRQRDELGGVRAWKYLGNPALKGCDDVENGAKRIADALDQVVPASELLPFLH